MFTGGLITVSVIMLAIYVKSKRVFDLIIKNLMLTAFILAVICVTEYVMKISIMPLNIYTGITAAILGIPGIILIILGNKFLF